MSLSAFTTLHVVICLLAIVAGIGFAIALLKGRDAPKLTATFLVLTILVSVTGFMFPSTGAFTPAQTVGVISLVILAAALLALYRFKLTGAWRWVYVVTAVMAFYLNAFVLVVQSFQKIPFLNALAPHGNEPPFLAVQAVVLVAFIVIGFLGVKHYHRAGTVLPA